MLYVVKLVYLFKSQIAKLIHTYSAQRYILYFQINIETKYCTKEIIYKNLVKTIFNTQGREIYVLYIMFLHYSSTQIYKKSFCITNRVYALKSDF